MEVTPVALTIAGSDSGGGAGIQADLKTFSAFGVFGASAITCITAQNPGAVTGIVEVPTELVRKQIRAVIDFFPVMALKTGMLYSADIINAVADELITFHGKIILDPVMVSTSGTKLLKDDAVEVLQKRLFPKASLITPNLDEMELLLEGIKIQSVAEMEKACKVFYNKYRVAVLLKGGHLQQTGQATDMFFDGSNFYQFQSEFVKGVNTHGTGCTLSAAIAANLVKGKALRDSIKNGKGFIDSAIRHAVHINEMKYLSHFPGPG